MRRLSFGLLSALLLASLHAAEVPKDALAVLPPGQGCTLLADYLLRECQKHFDARRKEVDALTTADGVLARQKAVRERWLAALGPMPERTPLNPRVVGTLDRDGYRIEKVIYESRPGHHVTANLYVPAAGKPPFPAVLISSGHSETAKAVDYNQAAAIVLAKSGFVALAYDPFGQGERIQTLSPDGKPLASGCTEHTLVDIGARLVGWCAASFRIWDGVRSADYLVSRPEVDPKRLGVTGCSGGGTMTSYLMATDERLVAAAPSCYITTLERLFATIGPQDGEQNIPNQVAFGIEQSDYLLLHAPRPVLLLTATGDFFDIGGSWTTFREAKRLFGLLGRAEAVDLFENPGGHGYPPVQRVAMLRWMRRWLQGVDDPTAAEPPIQLATVADLRCTQTGFVVRELKGRSAWDVLLDRAKQLAPERDRFWKETPKDQCLAEVRRLAAIRPLGAKPAARLLGTLDRDGYRIEKLLLERPDEMPLPALVFVPAKTQGKLPAVLYLDGRGKAHDAAPGGPIEALVKAGSLVLSLDARGFGETAPGKPTRFWHEEYPFAHLAFHLGRPLLGQRVEDTLAALGTLASRPDVDSARLRIVGIERGGPVALHAAALDDRLREVAVEQSIESWMDVVATPLCVNQMNQVVPAALTRYDLPDLVRSIAPRPVTIRNPVDPTGKPKKPQ